MTAYTVFRVEVCGVNCFEKTEKQWFDEIERESRARRRDSEPANFLSRLAAYTGECLGDLRDNFSLPAGAELKHLGARVL